MSRPILAAVAALVLVLGACGSDDVSGTAEDDPFVQAIGEELEADPANPFDGEQANCIALEIVDALGGPDVFLEAGITAEELQVDDSDQGVLAETGFEPTDEQIRDVGAAFANCGVTFIDLMGEDADDLSAEALDCLEEHVTDDVFSEVMGEVFLEMEGEGSEERIEAMVVQAVSPCLVLLAT